MTTTSTSVVHNLDTPARSVADTASGWILRHRRLVLLTWLLITIAGVIAAPGFAGRLQSGLQLHSPGYTANQALAREYGGAGESPSLIVIDLPAGQTVTSPPVRAALAAVDTAVAKLPGVRDVSYASTPDRALVGRGGASTVVLVYPPKATGWDDKSPLEQLAGTVRTALPGATATVTGVEELGAGSSHSGSGVLTEVLFGALASLLILAWVFGSVIAFVPLLTAVVSILTMQLAIGAVTHLFPGTHFNPAIQSIVAILGLGLSLDYALLIVSRWREERARGLDNAAAVEAACRHAGHAVAVSGVTASIGLFALAAIPVSFVRGVGISGLFIPSIAALVSLTLLPALLRTAGPRLDWPRRNRLTRHASSGTGAGGGWDRWARLVVRRRWAAATLGLVILGSLAGVATQINVALPALSSLAGNGPAHDGLQQLRHDGLPDGMLTALPLLLPAGTDPAAVITRERSVPGVTGAFAPTGPAWHAPSGSSVVLVVPAQQIAGTGQAAVLHGIRAAAPAADTVAGNEVLQADNTSTMYRWFPLAIGLVALVTLLFLIRALRSVVLPLKAVLLNLLSVAATYGVTVLLWQKGIVSHALFGLSSTGAINSLAPVLLFGFLFGLSMDYEVFILTRVREAYDRTGSTDEAVIEGIGKTGRLITSAALILFAALVSLSTAPDIIVKIIATGLGAGIVIDAVIVRSLLAPALVSLAGRANWWMPTELERLLRLPPKAQVRDPQRAQRPEGRI
jgi:uncharacterized membrane protein YdfJ with MMPL/SSD domain